MDFFSLMKVIIKCIECLICESFQTETKWRDKVGIYYWISFFDESHGQLHRMLNANLFRLKQNEEIS